MKFSIIIPSYNQSAFIRETLESILDQETGHEVEILVIDGGSDDGTLEILKEYDDRIRWISEKDRGQADAVNKGIKMAEGEVIGWLNSDDLYEHGTLHKVGDHFSKHPDCRWLYGKCRIMDENGKEIMKWVTRYKNFSLRRFSYRKLMRENFISQPAVFFRKELFELLGPLDIHLNYAMDYDLWLRFGRKNKACVINEYLSSFRRHGESKSETGFREQFREEYEVMMRYDPSWLTRIIHRFNMYKIIWGYRLISLF